MYVVVIGLLIPLLVCYFSLAVWSFDTTMYYIYYTFIFCGLLSLFVGSLITYDELAIGNTIGGVFYFFMAVLALPLTLIHEFVGIHNVVMLMSIGLALVIVGRASYRLSQQQKRVQI